MKAVEKSPLKVKFGGLHFKFSLSQPEPGQLRLLPNLGVRVLAWIFCVLGWPLLILGLLALIGLLSRPTFEQVVGYWFSSVWDSRFPSAELYSSVGVFDSTPARAK